RIRRPPIRSATTRAAKRCARAASPTTSSGSARRATGRASCRPVARLTGPLVGEAACAQRG
ncbi:hypothetical protein D8O05_30190, partial [Burkholderia mallei]